MHSGTAKRTQDNLSGGNRGLGPRTPLEIWTEEAGNHDLESMSRCSTLMVPFRGPNNGVHLRVTGKLEEIVGLYMNPPD